MQIYLLLGVCQQNNNTNDKRLLYNTELLNKPPFYIQVYRLYLRNVIMYKRNKVSNN